MGDVIQLFPIDPDVLADKAQELMDEGHTDKAMVLYKRILKIDPKHHEALINLGSLFMDTDEHHLHIRALTMFKRASRIHHDNTVMFNLGCAYVKLGKKISAIECFKEAHRLDPSDSEALEEIDVLSAELAEEGKEDEDA